MIVDAKRWINIHAYVMKYWKHVPIFLMLEWIVVGAISINIKAQITKPKISYSFENTIAFIRPLKKCTL
jgi:hypothetical protein